MGKCFLNDRGGLKVFPLLVHTSAGAKVTLTRGMKKYEATADSSGSACFALSKGTWTITLSDGTSEKVAAIDMTESKTYEFLLNKIPEFTYSGEYEVISDDNTPINYSNDNWKIRFLTSGELNITSLNGAEEGIDVFCVGGGGAGGSGNTGTGGAGGAGGFTATGLGVTIDKSVPFEIVVGGGGTGAYGTYGGTGGDTSAFGITAKGGGGASANYGGSGGSGGGGACSTNVNTGANGGSDGSNGTGGDRASGGTGQGTTTKEFGEEDGTLYAGGGGSAQWNSDGRRGGYGGAGGGGNGGAGSPGTDGATNTGGGGGGSLGPENFAYPGANGGSGIVIIRNKRQEVQ